MRPGRLDRIVYVGPPDQTAREEILNIRTKTMCVEPGFDVAEIARIVSNPPVIMAKPFDRLLSFPQTEGCSGAELSALCQEAALLTMQKDMNAPYVRFWPYVLPKYPFNHSNSRDTGPM